ncbi:hypothetical protein U9M48_040391, partial [Paspalum notatum var. saurae]
RDGAAKSPPPLLHSPIADSRAHLCRISPPWPSPSSPAAHKMPISKTVSTCTPEMEQGTHVFHILGYSHHRARATSKAIRSGKFSVGAHNWVIGFYPNGDNRFEKDCVIAFLLLVDKNTKVQASFEMRLLNQGAGPSLSVHKEASVFDPDDNSRISAFKIKRSLLEASTHLQDDRLIIECVLTVTKELRVTKATSFPKIQVPPSDIGEHFGRLLETKEGVDVIFSVGGVVFTAHKLVLAARSPVFRAELYGPMRERGTKPIVIEDVQPDVFRALLHFIYNDSLPPFEDLEADDSCEMIRHLLVAADRYAMERLKLICQSILCENLHVQTVATTLALADQHHCDMLKDACIEFITCSNSMDAVASTEGYKNLKRTCPSVVIEALEKTSRIRKAETRSS